MQLALRHFPIWDPNLQNLHSPSKVDFEFREAGTTIVLISGHLAELNKCGMNEWLCIY